MGAAARARRPEDVLTLLRARWPLPQGWFLFFFSVVPNLDQLSGEKTAWLTEAAIGW